MTTNLTNPKHVYRKLEDVASRADDALAAIRCLVESVPSIKDDVFLAIAIHRLEWIEEETLDVLPRNRRQSK